MSQVRPEDLEGEARRRYDTWRAVGLTEAGAMQVLREEGTLVSSGPGESGLASSLQGAFGLTKREAAVAAGGRESSVVVVSESDGRGVRLAESILDLARVRASEGYRALPEVARTRFDNEALGRIVAQILPGGEDQPWASLLGESGRARLSAGAAELGTTAQQLLGRL